MLQNKPTQEEIETILNYFRMENEEEAYNLYIKGLIEKHGQRWVEGALTYVIAKMSI